MKVTLGLAVLLCATGAVFCYRSPQRGPSGSYSLPSIGQYPAPTVFNPRNQGLPNAYKNYRFKRSMDDQDLAEHDQLVEEPALDEIFRQARSVDELNGEEPIFEIEPTELSRQRRSPYKIIQPTYRPPRKGPPKIYYV